jgi:hypothetical protein
MMNWQDAIGSVLTAGATGNPMAFGQNKLEQAFKQFQMQKMTNDLEMQREMHGMEKQKLDILLKQKQREDELENNPIGGILKVFGIEPPEGSEGVTLGQAKYAAPVAQLFQKESPEYKEMTTTEKPSILTTKGKGAGTVKELPMGRKPDKEAYGELFTDGKGNFQHFSKSEPAPAGWRPYEKPPSTKVDVRVDVGQKGMTKLAEEQGKEIVQERKAVEDAALAIQNLQGAKALLKKNMITGYGAETVLNIGRGLHQMGIRLADDPVSNTQAYQAIMAKETGRIIKMFGSGTGLSDADREYAEKAAAGKITLTRESLKKIVDINEKAYRNVIKNYNKKAKQVMDRPDSKDLPYDLLVQEPPLGAWVFNEKTKTWEMQ